MELFSQSFQVVYDRVKKNKEITQMFGNPGILKGKIKYNSLITNFISKFKHFYSIKSLFDILNPKK
jgi:hypothetical protein